MGNTLILLVPQSLTSSPPPQLLSKQEEYDRKQDVLFRDTSLSVAWTNIKAIGYSEVQEKRQLLYALQHGVIEPLIAFRVRPLIVPRSTVFSCCSR